jgi:hypothetical protein
MAKLMKLKMMKTLSMKKKEISRADKSITISNGSLWRKKSLESL